MPDTLQVVLDSVKLISGASQESGGVSDALIGAISALFGTVLGGAITIWYKKSEIKNMSDNLNLQKKVFEESKKNNENEIKAEIVRLKNLRREYELNLQKHDFELLTQMLNFSENDSEKTKMIKELAGQISKYLGTTPSRVRDQDDYEEFVAQTAFVNLTMIKSSLDKLLVTYPKTFITVQPEVKAVASDALYLSNWADELNDLSGGNVPIYDVITKLQPSLLSLHYRYVGLLEKMKEEFAEIEEVRRKFIRSEFEKASK